MRAYKVCMEWPGLLFGVVTELWSGSTVQQQRKLFWLKFVLNLLLIVKLLEERLFSQRVFLATWLTRSCRACR